MRKLQCRRSLGMISLKGLSWQLHFRLTERYPMLSTSETWEWQCSAIDYSCSTENRWKTIACLLWGCEFSVWWRTYVHESRNGKKNKNKKRTFATNQSLLVLTLEIIDHLIIRSSTATPSHDSRVFQLWNCWEETERVRRHCHGSSCNRKIACKKCSKSTSPTEKRWWERNVFNVRKVFLSVGSYIFHRM